MLKIKKVKIFRLFEKDEDGEWENTMFFFSRKKAVDSAIGDYRIIEDKIILKKEDICKDCK